MLTLQDPQSSPGAAQVAGRRRWWRRRPRGCADARWRRRRGPGRGTAEAVSQRPGERWGAGVSHVQNSRGADVGFRKQEEARKHILDQILHPEAADRLGRIRLVKEQRATDVENRLIMLAQSGQLRQKVTEAQLKDLLNAVADNKEEEKIVVNRRKGWDDEDDDLLDL